MFNAMCVSLLFGSAIFLVKYENFPNDIYRKISLMKILLFLLFYSFIISDICTIFIHMNTIGSTIDT